MATIEDIVREEVRRVVAELLRRRGGETSRGQERTLAVLFCGTRWPGEDLFGQLEALAARGTVLEALASETFRNFHGERLAERWRTDAQWRLLPGGSESELVALAKRCDALVIGALSCNTATKVALGIADSVPSSAIRLFLEGGKPVVVAEDSAAFRAEAVAPAAPPKLRRLAEDAVQGLSEMGVRFAETQSLVAVLDEVFHVPVNETPERLAKTRPSMRRMFVTSEDVWAAASRGQRELVLPADAVITDEARDHARRLGLEIVRSAS